MAPLVTRTAADLLAAMEAGEITAVDVTRAHLERISATDDRVNAFVRTLDEAALTHAADVDRRREAGEPVGSLGGLPLALKDLLCTRGVETTCSSRILEHYRPPYDATVVRKLREADAIVVGKTNMDEFAMGSSTENSAFGPTRNPWNLGRVPGGSSGGSSAALAALHAPLAIGTDTGGSVRQPAALCGLVGLKPTYGTVSRYGLIAFASSIELAGPMARTVRDAALLHTAIAGHDPCDATSAPGAVPDVLSGLEEGIEDLRIGMVREFSGEGLADGVHTGVSDAVDRLGALGAKVTEISLPHASYGLPAYYLIAPSEASSNLSRFDGVRYGLRRDGETTEQMMARTRGEGFGPEVKRRIMIGTYALSAGYYDAYYAQAQRVRTLIMRDFEAAFAEVDVLVGPTSPTTAFRLGEKADDPLAMYLNDVYSVPASLAGVPAISVPCGLDEQGLPVGLQLIGPSLGEATLLRAARALEADLGFDPVPRGEGALELPGNGDGGNP